MDRDRRIPDLADHLSASVLGRWSPFAVRLVRETARQLVRHPGILKSDRDDIEQELLMELLRKFTRFERGRVRETTFIARIVRTKAISLVRARLAEKRHYRRNGHSLSDLVSDSKGRLQQRAQLLQESSAKRHRGQPHLSELELAQLQHDVSEILDRVPQTLREVARLLQEMSAHSVSRTLGRSRRQVAKAMAELRTRFENAELHDYV